MGQDADQMRTNPSPEPRPRVVVRTVNDEPAGAQPTVPSTAESGGFRSSTSPVSHEPLQRQPLTSTGSSGGGGSDVRAARREIERTRAEMSQTIDAIQDRLDPQMLMDKAKDTANHLLENAKEQAKDTAVHLMESAKENAKEAVSDATQHAKDTALDLAGQARDAVRDATIGRVERMVNIASDSARGFSSGVVDTIRANPIPAALVGLGLGWMFFGGSSRRSTFDRRYDVPGYPLGSQRGTSTGQHYSGGHGMYTPHEHPSHGESGLGGTMNRARDSAGDMMSSVADTTGSMASSVADTTSNVANTVAETTSNVASTVAETTSQVANSAWETAGSVAGQASDAASYVVDRTYHGAEYAQGQVQDLLRTNPLAVGLVAAGVGLAVGMMFPTTHTENELLGETRDQLLEQAKAFASTTGEKLQDIAGEVQQTVQRGAQAQGLTGTSSSSDTRSTSTF